MKTIGERLIELREKNNLNKIEFSKMLGLNKSTITRYETGEMKPTLDVMIQIAKSFNVTLDWLAGFDTEPIREYDNVVKECVEENISPARLQKAVELLKG